MLDEWNVFNHFDYVGKLIYDTNTTEFSFKYLGTSDAAYGTREIINWDKDPKWFKETLFDRVCPPDRVDIREILRSVGLKHYDAWELLKKSHMSSYNDLIWMQKGMKPKMFYMYCLYGGFYAKKEGLDLKKLKKELITAEKTEEVIK